MAVQVIRSAVLLKIANKYMPRRRDHVDAGLIIIFLVWWIAGFKNFSFTFIANSTMFILGNIAPDFLEPAYHFSHRKFFHSWKMLRIVIVSMIIFASLGGIFKLDYFLFIASLAAGYADHLFLDSRSKIGLPGGGSDQIGFKP
jgi:hypothetical protein